MQQVQKFKDIFKINSYKFFEGFKFNRIKAHVLTWFEIYDLSISWEICIIKFLNWSSKYNILLLYVIFLTMPIIFEERTLAPNASGLAPLTPPAPILTSWLPNPFLVTVLYSKFDPSDSTDFPNYRESMKRLSWLLGWSCHFSYFFRD